MIGLPCSEETVIICVAVSIEYRNVRDRQTDRQTDRIAISISRVSILTRDKTYNIHVRMADMPQIQHTAYNNSNVHGPLQATLSKLLTYCVRFLTNKSLYLQHKHSWSFSVRLLYSRCIWYTAVAFWYSRDRIRVQYTVHHS